MKGLTIFKARPSVQPTSSHSRLVTAKLTASTVVSASTAGWSRPSSVAPSPANGNTPSSTSPLPTGSSTQTSSTAAPQLPHVGKVIQPQPRAPGAQLVSLQKEAGGSKAVWGNAKPPTVLPIRPDIQTNDFPTAAEVANGRPLFEQCHTYTENNLHSQYRTPKANEIRGDESCF